MTLKKRRLAGAVCAVFVMAMLFSCVFIVVEKHHDCTRDEHCPVCRTIVESTDFLSHAGMAMLLLAALMYIARMTYGYGAVHGPFVCTVGTLVREKVRLND
ncbi:MAG: hypothetical protein IJ083_12345 [Clostridia bacterium]|nr:hypothetical protein [Clostridia bacterium]